MEEIVIRLKPRHLKQIGYAIILLVLVGLLIVQHFYPNCSSTEEVAEEEVTAKASVTIIKADEDTAAETTENTSGNSATVVTTVEETVEENTTEEVVVVEEDEDLPITGEITFTIDKINYVIKGEDYARIVSIQFTIKNQKADIDPVVKAYLDAYGTDDTKSITLVELEAGKSITKTSTKLTFGYNNIDEDQKVIVKLYDGSKIIKTVTKTFKTEED